MRRLLTAIVVVLVLLVVADRIAVAVTSSVIASRMQVSAGLSAKPSVSIKGFPFLTQAIGGRYEHVVVRTGSLAREGVRIAELDVSLTGVQIPLSEALSGSVGSVPVSGIAATATVTFADVAQKGSIAGISVTPLGSGVRVTGRVTVLGQSVTAATDSTVRLEGRTIVITAQRVSVLGQSSSLLNKALAGRFDFRVPVGTLPYGLHLSGVRPTTSGLVLAARAGATVIPVGTS
ncbi:MAG: hypothetical protein JWO12_2664 [Frankiales bacterium]|nr:hypothetical protein [Frankiales bacterium]